MKKTSKSGSNTGDGNQFINNDKVEKQVGTYHDNSTTNNYYGQKDLDQSNHDDQIIQEIFDFIDVNIRVSPTVQVKGNFTNLSLKIPINFPETEYMKIKDMILSTIRRRNLVGDYLTKLETIEAGKPTALQLKIQSNFCKTLGVDHRDVKIQKVEFLEKLALTIIPKSKRNDSIYLANANAIILYFFDFCKIGKMTEDEISTYNQQLSLFDF